ncbi:MAG: aminotransferase class IV [Phycisphaerales bacterium]|nr:aminotransferase class IV [Phycisphaerales bacterium]
MEPEGMRQLFNEKNRDLIVNIGGTLVHRDQAGVSPFDSSVQNGDAVWEGLRLYDGRIFRLTAHLDRLHDSARALQYADIPSHDVIRREIHRTLDANAMHDGVHIRLTLSRGLKYTSGLDPRINTFGPLLIVLAEHKPPVYDKTGITLKTSGHRRPSSDVLDQKIHSCNQLTSILAKLEANAAGADDALMLDTHGFIAETNATHVFIVRNGIVRTPTTAACPEGITRQAVLDMCQQHEVPCEVTNLTLAEVYRADEMFCTGTMGELAAVMSVDGRMIGAHRPDQAGVVGPVTQKLSALFRDMVEREAEAILMA